MFFREYFFLFFFFFFLLNSWNVFSDGYLRHWTPGKVNFSCVVCRWRRPVQWKNKRNTNISVSDARPWLTAHTAHNSMVYDVRFLCVPWPLKAIVKMVRRARAPIVECTCGVASHQGSFKVIKIAYTDGKFSTYAWFLHRNDNIIAFHRVFAQCAWIVCVSVECVCMSVRSRDG